MSDADFKTTSLACNYKTTSLSSRIQGPLIFINILLLCNVQLYTPSLNTLNTCESVINVREAQAVPLYTDLDETTTKLYH